MIHYRFTRISMVLILLAGNLLCAPTGSFGITVSYFGETVTHPGISVEASYQIPVTSWYSYGIGAELFTYTHPRNHTAASAALKLYNRISFSNGFSSSLNLLAGYHGSVPAGEVFAGPAHSLSLFERLSSNLLAGSEGTVDILILEDPENRVEASLALMLFGQWPYNGYMLPHTAVKAGIRWEQ